MVESDSKIETILSKLLGGKLGFVLAVLFASASIAFAAYHAYKTYAQPGPEFSFATSGMSDFHNGSYYPSMAFRFGDNPYAMDVCDKYPMARSTPPYSPMVFVLYMPFSYLSLYTADIAFFAFNTLLMGWVAWFCVNISRQVIERSSGNQSGLLSIIGNDWTAAIWLFGWLMFSRPGHVTMFTGYFTLQLVIGTILALHYAEKRPWLAAIGMLLTSGKPTYIIPLTILMIARRNFRTVIIGLILCAVFAGGGLAWLASHSDFSSVIQGIKEGQEAFDNDPNELPRNTWTRLDIVGVIGKSTGWTPSGMTCLALMCVMLVPIGWLVYRSKTPDESEDGTSLAGWTAAVCQLAMLISIYHHSYDGLLAIVVWANMVCCGSLAIPGLPKWARWSTIVLLTIPAVNYASTMRFRDLVGLDNWSPIWNVIVSVNGVCILVALLILCLTVSKSGNDH